MDLLNQYSDNEDEESRVSHISDVNKQDPNSESEESEDIPSNNEKQTVEANPAPAPSDLPSVFDLLNEVNTRQSSIRPVSSSTYQDQILPALKRHRYDEPAEEEESKAKYTFPSSSSQPKPSSVNSKPSTMKEEVRKPVISRERFLKMQADKNTLPLPAAPPASSAKDKTTAKERVKKQRLQGQSGIGEDFKTWRSEEEMRQRQQYD